MPDSLKFVLVFLGAGALATPLSLYVQRIENQEQAKIMAVEATGGDPGRGKQIMLRHGCGACHNMPGVSGAVGQVGPKLAFMTQRAELAGRKPNQPADLIAWIRHPQQISPGSGMPRDGAARAGRPRHGRLPVHCARLLAELAGGLCLGLGAAPREQRCVDPLGTTRAPLLNVAANFAHELGARRSRGDHLAGLREHRQPIVESIRQLHDVAE